MAKHHLSDDFLLEYASGATDPGYALVVACHATLCPRCRSEIETHEAIASALLNSTTRLSDAEFAKRDSIEAITRRAVEAAKLEQGIVPTESVAFVPSPSDLILPWPLQKSVGPIDKIAWKSKIPGLKVYDFTLPGTQMICRLTQTNPGMGVARHGHTGIELDLVLSGGLFDETLNLEYERGDVQIATEALEHELRVLPGEPCTVLTVSEGPLKPRGWMAQLVYRWLRWT